MCVGGGGRKSWGEEGKESVEGGGDLSALAMLTCAAAAWRLEKEIHRPQRPGKLNTCIESQTLPWITRDLADN